MRKPNWDVELGTYIAESEAMRFRYGIHDCCLFAAGAIQVMCGFDPMKELRGYRGIKGAAKLLGVLGGIEAAVVDITKARGFREVTVLGAQRGDLVMADMPRPSLGIVSLDGWNAAFASRSRLVRIPLSMCRRAWRIE